MSNRSFLLLVCILLLQSVLIGQQGNYILHGFSSSTPLFNSLARFSKGNRFHYEALIGYNFSSDANTAAVGLTDNFSRRMNYAAKVGFWFLRGRKIRVGLKTGLVYRDFGFKENDSHIVYGTIPVGLTLQTGKLYRFLKFEIRGSVEFARSLANKYRYFNSATQQENYNFHLHQNDALLFEYGGTLVFGKGRIGVLLFSEYILQLDNYDKQFGRTIGSVALGIGIRYQ